MHVCYINTLQTIGFRCSYLKASVKKTNKQEIAQEMSLFVHILPTMLEEHLKQ